MDEETKHDLADTTKIAARRAPEFAEVTDDDLAATTGGCGCGSAACANVAPNNMIWPPR